jgi:hypothetical protein
VDLDRTFKDYLQRELDKLASSKPLKITGLSENEDEIGSRVKVIYKKSKTDKISNLQPTEDNLKVNGSKIGNNFCEDSDNEETRSSGTSYKAHLIF